MELCMSQTHKPMPFRPTDVSRGTRLVVRAASERKVNCYCLSTPLQRFLLLQRSAINPNSHSMQATQKPTKTQPQLLARQDTSSFQRF